MKKLSVLGAGAWGTALAYAFRECFDEVSLWSYLKQDAESINATHTNEKYLPEVPLTSIIATDSIQASIQDADIIISAVPSFSIRSTWTQIADSISSNTIFINASKGIEKDTHLFPYEIFKEVIHKDIPYLSLCGPSFATDVGKNFPTAVNLAGEEHVSKKVIEQLQTDTFFLRYSDDIIGTELGAILKNVVAIASGVVIGMNYSHNTQALVVVEGIKEMTELGAKMKAKSATMFGLAGVGDLLLTAMNNESRNMKLGMSIGGGVSVEESLKQLNGVSEGYYSAQSLKYFMDRYSITLPLFEMVINIVIHNKNVKQELDSFLKKSYA